MRSNWLRMGLVPALMAAVMLQLPAALRAEPSLVFSKAPTGEVASDSLVQLGIMVLPMGSRAADSCSVFRSPTPRGDSLAGHDTRIASARVTSKDSTAYLLAFKPASPDPKGSPQLGLGYHYLVVACDEGKYVSSELPLWVTTSQSTSILTPKAEETSASPNITWTPVPGVPAYHLLLSDQAINIDAGKGTVTGASVIWQAITTKTSIAYGTPDPSGNFSRLPAPPLSPNVPYNLVILNNYDGRSPLGTSSKAQGLRLFTLKSQTASLSKPENISPTGKAILAAPNDSLIRFEWRAAKAGTLTANTYKLYLYSLETQDDLDVLLPIFQSEVTDTFAVVDAKRILLSKRYIWKVFALNSEGAGTVGDTSSFQYRNDVQTLSISTLTLGPFGDSVALGDVRIDVAPLEGGADALPLFSTATGNAEKVMAVGGYKLTLAKDGYTSQSRTVTLGTSGPLQVKFLLTPSACRITGRLVDGKGSVLDNAQAQAVGGGKTVAAWTDAGGNFLLGVAPGTYAVSFTKTDYQSPPDTILSLTTGQALDIGLIPMSRPTGSLSGSVANTLGVPLSGCQVLIKTSVGGLVRSLLTDDQGRFSAFLSPGTYLVSASRTGFTGAESQVQLSETASIRLELASGASIVKGRIDLQTRQVAIAPRTAPLAAATVELTRKAKNAVTLKRETDLYGEYSVSVDTGTYILKASWPGRAFPESTEIMVTAPRTTTIQNLTLVGLASIQGTLSFSPDTVVDAASVSISLLQADNLDLVLSTTPQAAPVSGGAGNMAFTFAGVPDGSYRVTCGLPGFGLDPEPVVTISDAIWKTDLVLNLKKAVKSLTFNLKADTVVISGAVRLLTPQTAIIPSGTTLQSASAGTYSLRATPDSGALIPLSRYAFALASGGAVDTTITLAFPFTHQVIPLAAKNQEVEIILASKAPIDSALIIYGYGMPTDTLRITAAQSAGPPGTRSFRLKPGDQGGLLAYYFVIRNGKRTYANDEAVRWFRAAVEPSHALAALRIDAGDSLRFPEKSRCGLLLHAYDAAGNRLDTAVDGRGTVQWTSNSAMPAKLGKKNQRNLVIQTDAAPSATGKKPQFPRWDTLHVTVSLEDVARSLEIPAQVVSTRINRLALTTTLGEIAELANPATFGLHILGFDTTTSPPTVMTPNPEIFLVPPQAGNLKDMQVTLHPDFIGPVRILAKHVNPDGTEALTELGASADSLVRGLNIGQTLRSGDSARLLFHDPRFELRIPDSALASDDPMVLRMYERAVSKTFASGVKSAIAGGLYEIANPSGAVFLKPPRLSLGIPAAVRTRRNRFQGFNTGKLDWMDMADSVSEETNSFSTPALAADLADLDGYYYALLSDSKSLTAGAVEIMPNPFSPLVLANRDGNTQYGARIRLHPESDRSSEITVTIKIYNLDGELVRHLVEHKTVPKAAIDFYWDGRADGGRWARNGRYLVKIAVNSTGTPDVRYLVKPVVLFQ